MKAAPNPHPENTQTTPNESVDTGSVRKMSDRPDRPSPYYVGWTVEGQRRKLAFKTAKARDEKMRELEKEAQRGTLALVPTREELRDWRAFKRAVGDTPWLDVVTAWRSSASAPCTTTVAVAVDGFLAGRDQRVESGTIDASTVAHQRCDLLRLRDAFGGQALNAPTPEALEAWIDDLGFESHATFNSKLKVLRAFYNDAVAQGLVSKNPADKIKRRDGSVGEVKINTVVEIATLFAHALQHNPEALGRLALEAFAGLRFSSAYRLEKHDINFVDRGVLLPGHKLKTRRRRYIDGLPDNLWLWLEVTNDACWALQESEWMHLKSEVFDAAKVPHPHNSLRHSFCTHHVAWLKDAGRTAAILCHTSQQELWEHYNGCATTEAGRWYFEIAPKTAGGLAKDPKIRALTYPRPETPVPPAV